MRRGKGKEETGVDGKPEEGERGGGMKGRGQGGDRGCGYKLLRVRPGGPLLPGGRSMALPVGLLLLSVSWLHSVAGPQHGGEERCDSIWGWTFENLSCHMQSNQRRHEG